MSGEEILTWVFSIAAILISSFNITVSIRALRSTRKQ